MPLTACNEQVTIPADKIEPSDIVFRLGDDVSDLGLAARDLLVIEPRAKGRAATGELVIASLHERTFIGRWWAKHGRRALLDDEFRTIVEVPELLVLGAVTLVARDETR
jgi:hypothetical protein